jgi:hypothetical protein
VGAAFGAAGERKVENGFANNNHPLEDESHHINLSEAIKNSVHAKDIFGLMSRLCMQALENAICNKTCQHQVLQKWM